MFDENQLEKSNNFTNFLINDEILELTDTIYEDNNQIVLTSEINS